MHTNIKRYANLIGSFLLALSVQSLGAQSRVSVMAYNVENFFDTTHDATHEDWAYLPRSTKQSNPQQKDTCLKRNKPGSLFYDECMNLDWSDSVFQTKLEHVSDAILTANQGIGPDILIIEEIENAGVLAKLNERLAASKYISQFITEGYDSRGINVAILSRFPLVHAEQYKIPFDGSVNRGQSGGALQDIGTRAILRADLKLPNGVVISVFGGHLPSQSHVSAYRKTAIGFINQLQAQLPAGQPSITGGDFNTTAEEDRSNGLIRTDLASQWLVSHIIGCKSCKGTEVYKGKGAGAGGSWSFLDVLGFSKDMDPAANGKIQVDPASVRIPNGGLYQTFQGQPDRFDAAQGRGTSDHWPIYAELILH